jgi:hypothetical protein
MPNALTAENGAKALLIGEFHVETQVPNPDYDPDLDDEDEEPEFFTAQIAIPWDTIKAIYAMAVKHLAKPLGDSPMQSCDVSFEHVVGLIVMAGDTASTYGPQQISIPEQAITVRR